ncbi:MAG: 6-bladed beta-propeller [Longimicrobiales bacterium]
MLRSPEARQYLLPVAFAALYGCADRSCLPPLARDSAGIRIVEHSAGVLAALPPQLLGDPDLRIGELEGEPVYEFARVAGVVPLSDDRLAVADAGNSEVRFFSSSGAFQYQVGRPGNGPNEFRNLFAIWPLQEDSMRRWARSSGDRNLVLELPLTVNAQYTAAGQHVCLADSDAFEVRCYTRARKLALIVRAAPPERPVTQAIIDSFLVMRTRRPLDEARRVSVWQEIPFPRTLPAYMDLLGDSRGAVWVARYLAPGDSASEWLQFADDGRLLRRLQIPASLRLLAAAGHRLFGVQRDSMGVDYVSATSCPWRASAGMSDLDDSLQYCVKHP